MIRTSAFMLGYITLEIILNLWFRAGWCGFPRYNDKDPKAHFVQKVDSNSTLTLLKKLCPDGKPPRFTDLRKMEKLFIVLILSIASIALAATGRYIHTRRFLINWSWSLTGIVWSSTAGQDKWFVGWKGPTYNPDIVWNTTSTKQVIEKCSGILRKD